MFVGYKHLLIIQILYICYIYDLEMKSKSGWEPQDNEFNTSNKLSSEKKNIKDKQDSAVNAMWQVDSKRQQKTCTKLSNEKTPVKDWNLKK